MYLQVNETKRLLQMTVYDFVYDFLQMKEHDDVISSQQIILSITMTFIFVRNIHMQVEVFAHFCFYRYKLANLIGVTATHN